jgi:hypothetical protein
LENWPIHKIVMHTNSPVEGVGAEENMLNPMPNGVTFSLGGNTMLFALDGTIRKEIGDLVYTEHHYVENPAVEPTHHLERCSYDPLTFEAGYRVEPI